MPANTVRVMRPAGEVVSAQGSASERRPAPTPFSCSATSSSSFGRPRKAVEPSDDHDVLVPERVKHSGELRTVPLRVRDLLLVEAAAAGRLQRGALQEEIVVVGRDAGAAHWMMLFPSAWGLEHFPSLPTRTGIHMGLRV